LPIITIKQQTDLLTKTITMDTERIIKEKLGYKYFITFSEYTNTWACIHADHLKYYYNEKDNIKDLRIVYGNTLDECVKLMCKIRGIDIGNGGSNELWFEYSTD